MDIMTHAKFYFNRLMLTLIFAIRASEPPRAWRTTEKAGPDRVKTRSDQILAKLINQTALFSSRRPKNFENEKFPLLENC